MYELDLWGTFQPCFLWFCKPVISVHMALPGALWWLLASAGPCAVLSTGASENPAPRVTARGHCSAQRCLVRVNPGGICPANSMSETEQRGGTVSLSRRVSTWPCGACAALPGEGICHWAAWGLALSSSPRGLCSNTADGTAPFSSYTQRAPAQGKKCTARCSSLFSEKLQEPQTGCRSSRPLTGMNNSALESAFILRGACHLVSGTADLLPHKLMTLRATKYQ